jgi:hypothetical protein
MQHVLWIGLMDSGPAKLLVGVKQHVLKQNIRHSRTLPETLCLIAVSTQLAAAASPPYGLRQLSSHAAGACG